MAKPQLPPDFKEFLSLCLAREVGFMVVGGLAVIHHGHPRLTLDMDLWIERSEENGRRIIAVLNDFGFPAPEVTPADFAKEKQILRMGFKPVVIEILNVSLSATASVVCRADGPGWRHETIYRNRAAANSPGL